MTALGIGDGDVLLEGIQVKDPVVSCHWGIIGLTVRSGSTLPDRTSYAVCVGMITMKECRHDRQFLAQAREMALSRQAQAPRQLVAALLYGTLLRRSRHETTILFEQKF